MGFLDRFRRKNDEPVHTVQSINTLPQTNYYNIPREDGSILSIAPETDKMGNQLYSQIYNTNTNQLQLIPRFWVISDELRAASIHSNLIHESILIDIDPNILQNPYYASQVANVLLSADRMSKVMKQYHQYAGGLEYDQNGYVVGKYVDNGIISSLQIDATERETIRQASVQKDLEDKKTAAKHITPHREDYSEQVLSQDMLNEYR